MKTIKAILITLVMSGLLAQASSATETTYYFGINKEHATALYTDPQLACNEHFNYFKDLHPEHCGWSGPTYRPIYRSCKWNYYSACSSSKSYKGMIVPSRTCVDPKIPKLVYTTYAHYTCAEPPAPVIPPPEPKSFGEPPCDVNSQVGG